VQQVIGPELVGAYLHSSAVLGGFDPRRSDLDIVAVSCRALSDEDLHDLADRLGAGSYPANGLEFTLLTADEASQPQMLAPRFQLHRTTDGWDRRAKVVDGRTREGDPDLVLHLFVARDHGRALVGPPARDVFGEVPRSAVIAAMKNELAWASAHALREYLVLTACRAWFFHALDRVASKVEAGRWAAGRYERPDVIEAALVRQTGAGAPDIADAESERLVTYVERVLA